VAEGFAQPRATLRGRDVLAITVGIVIGAGIFRAPGVVAGAAASELQLLLAWAAGGLLSIVGALCYAELASAYPHVGGDYHFLERAFGRRIGFLYAWARMAVIQTGSMALLAYVFGDYASSLAPLGPYSSSLYAAAAVIALSAANWAGVRMGAQVQRWLTLFEVAGLVLVIVAGLLVSSPDAGVSPATREGGSFGLMMVFVLLSFGGWSEAVYVSAEVEDAPRRMGKLMVAGLALVTLLYLLANFAYLNALGFAGLARSDAVAADVMRLAMGEGGVALISLVVGVAALTSANATAMTGARSACALGRSFVQLSWLGRWHGKRDTPHNAIVLQAAIALLLVVAGGFARDGFELAVEYTAPVFWLFLLLVGIGLFVLRMREPQVVRPFRVPLYPLLPAVFCATSLYLLYSSVAYTGIGALVGIGVLIVGAALLLLLRPVSVEESEG
jgi:APA family basic amino acid/polyamine antiporter